MASEITHSVQPMVFVAGRCTEQLCRQLEATLRHRPPNTCVVYSFPGANRPRSPAAQAAWHALWTRRDGHRHVFLNQPTHELAVVRAYAAFVRHPMVQRALEAQRASMHLPPLNMRDDALLDMVRRDGGQDKMRAVFDALMEDWGTLLADEARRVWDTLGDVVTALTTTSPTGADLPPRVAAAMAMAVEQPALLDARCVLQTVGASAVYAEDVARRVCIREGRSADQMGQSSLRFLAKLLVSRERVAGSSADVLNFLAAMTPWTLGVEVVPMVEGAPVPLSPFDAPTMAALCAAPARVDATFWEDAARRWDLRDLLLDFEHDDWIVLALAALLPFTAPRVVVQVPEGWRRRLPPMPSGLRGEYFEDAEATNHGPFAAAMGMSRDVQ